MKQSKTSSQDHIVPDPLTLLERVLDHLRDHYRRQGRTALSESFKPYLTSHDIQTPYRRLAEDLGMTEGAVKVGVHRLRRRYRDLPRGEIARTVTGPEEVEEEIRFLRAAVSTS